MTSKDIENNVVSIVDNFSKEEFVYDLLLAYGSSKATITRLKKGDFNLSKKQGEVLLKSKLFFKVDIKENLLATAEESAQDENILRHKPRFIIVTDFETLLAIDTKTKARKDIKIGELARHYDFFLPLGGSEVYNTKNDNKADREAAYKMAELYDGLISANEGEYSSKESVHCLNIFLSRLLFCLFAEDTGIFDEEGVFTNSLGTHTQQDGSDVNIFLDQLFERLNTRNAEKFPAYMAEKFPYVNGGLFRDNISSPRFTTATRKILIALGDLQWQEINPDIFGSMIQAVVLPEYRSDLGMHYTSVENILKLIKPLFLDELYEEFEKHQDNIDQLRKLIMRMSKIRFFDPACGSGNFLIITYKELRVLEIEILKRIIEIQPPLVEYTEITLSQFYGIELDDFAHEMAILSLWLAEHQMNKVFEEQLVGYGESKPILPLKEAGHIVCGNATRQRWEDVCSNNNGVEVYIIGNPPYLGYSKQDAIQKSDMEIVFSSVSNYKKLDYIACWFYKAAEYIQNRNSKFAFVSTNSISQGEQVALLWPHLFNLNIEIGFVYTSFKWTNNAKGNAGVAVVIVGMRNVATNDKYIYYDNIKTMVKNISPYFTNSHNIYIRGRKHPLGEFPPMIKGSAPSDGGNLLLNSDEYDDCINESANNHTFIKRYIGASEFMNNSTRYCIYVNKDQYLIAKAASRFLCDRFRKVELFRLSSSKSATNIKANIPYAFDEDKYIEDEFILIPQTGSERREYLPVGFFDKTYVPSNATRVIYNAQPWIFGMLSSKMHIVWVKAVAGRQKMDPQYSNTLCYNTFPFPNISDKQKESLNLYVFGILDERAKHPEKTMAQLYDPDKMPSGLKQAHKELDEAIERCYRLQPFKNDTERLEYLFKLYEEMTTKETLFAKQPKQRKKKS